jgi:tetratricopeptide (TPR) repeat protein
MKGFGFKKKHKLANEINRLFGLLKENPDDTKSRLRLANLCLQVGDEKTAIKQYCGAAKQLGAEGLYLEPIAIYRKILSLDSISLVKGSLATIQKAEEHLAKARMAYEEVFQREAQDHEAQHTQECQDRENEERGDDRETEEISSANDSESVPVEVVPDPPQDEAVSRPGVFARAEDIPPDQRATPLSGDLTEPDGEGRDQESFESPNPLLSSSDSTLDQGSGQGSAHEDQITWETDSSYPTKNHQIDVNNPQIDDDLETMLSDEESEPPTEDPQSPDFRAGDDDPSAISSAFQEPDHPETSPRLDATQSVQERPDQTNPDLLYSLGMVYYDMDSIDKAIKAFVNAHDRGVKVVESLSMLAKCYCKKGLFHNAAGFIGQALKLDNLTQEQIDMLMEQLEAIKERGHSAARGASAGPQK